MKKSLYFFGCSFTAGDELSDEIFFPWKSECTNPHEYYIKRNEVFDNKNGMLMLLEYKQQNYNLAYPAQIEKLTGYTVFNHADNGASLREMIFKIIYQVSSNDKPDYVFLQIPPTAREYVVDDVCPISIQMSTLGYVPQAPRLENYIKAKVAEHAIYSWTVDDFMDLLMLDGFLTKHNIPHKFLDITSLEFRQREITGLKRYGFLNDEINKLDVLNLTSLCESNRLLGGHFDLDSHKHYAKYIVDNVLSNTQSK